MNTEEIETLNPLSAAITPELLAQSNVVLTELVETQSLLREEIKSLGNHENDEVRNIIIAINRFMQRVNSAVGTGTLITILQTQSAIVNERIITKLQTRCEELKSENETLKVEIKDCKSSKKNPVSRWAEKVLEKRFH